MITHRRRERLVATCLSALAGYVDALGFLKLGGFFVSFMSGNSTRLGVGLSQGHGAAALPAGLIALFVCGVVVGSLCGHAAAARRRQAVLLLVALLLSLAALFDMSGMERLGLAAVALAMGAENAVFERNGEVSIGVTYMTGNLVKLGQRLTAALLGGDRWAWTWYLLLWLGLVAGATLGAALYGLIGMKGLWPAAAAAVMLSFACNWLDSKSIFIRH